MATCGIDTRVFGFDVWRARSPAVLRIVVCALEIIERRRKRKVGEPRIACEHQIEYSRDTATSDVTNRADKLRIQKTGVDQLEKRAFRIEARHNSRCRELLAVEQSNA